MAKDKFEDIQDDDLFQEIIANWDAVNSVEKDQRAAANEDARFTHIRGEQWSTKEQSERKNKPLYEINRIVSAVNTVVGAQRQNTISLKTIPLGSGATKEIADTLNGLTRNIENRSHFDDIQSSAFKEVATGGYGAWQVSTGYANDESINQDISIKGIRDAANSVFFDNGSVEDNHRDANWCFVLADIPLSQFKKMYPDASPTNLENDKDLYHSDWCNRENNTVRIADYWTKKAVKVEAVFVSDGKTSKRYEVNEEYERVKDELADKNFQEVNRRTIVKYEVVHYKISGAQILEGAKKWDGKYIPVVLTYGYTIWIEGKRYVNGIVRNSRDSQRLYNYSRSAIAEAQGKAKTDPLWMTADQATGYESEIGKDKAIQLYNHEPSQPPPFRTGAPAVQQALLEIANQAIDDIKATTGFFDPSLGTNPAAQSGRAILALQAQGDQGTYELQDNLVSSIEYTDEIIMDLAPRIYDTERQETILNPDGNEEIVYINKEIVDEQTGETSVLNDLSQGTYAVLASNGANYKTKRVETLNTLMQLRREDPLVAQSTTDILLGNLDSPIAPELEKRARKIMLGQGVVEPTEDELKEIQSRPPAQPTPAQLAEQEMIVLEVEKKAGEVDLIEIEIEQKRADIDKTKAETAKTYADAKGSFTKAKGDFPFTPEDIETSQNLTDATNTTVEENFETGNSIQNLQEEITEEQNEPSVEETLILNQLQNQEE